MGMTLASMDAQSKRSDWAEQDAAAQADGFSPNTTVQTKATAVATVKPADSNGQHFSKTNDYGNTQKG